MTLYDAVAASVGGFTVRRALPRRGLRTVGAWCFADHMGPELVTETQGLDVGPHPHIGLQTVTWLVDGAVLHRDSLGSEQVIRPGQLNLMTAGHGIAHAEEAVPTYRGTLHGVQLWIAQPDGTRDGGSAFAHHATLPEVDLGHGSGTVLVGEFGDAVSDAKVDTALTGLDAAVVAGSSTWPLRPDFEYALYCLTGSALVTGPGVEGATVGEGQLLDLGRGRAEIVVTTSGPTRLLLLGGEPLGEPLVMWWNFVGRSGDEIERAAAAWARYGRDDERFGRVGSQLAAIPAPALPPRLLPRA